MKIHVKTSSKNKYAVRSLFASEIKSATNTEEISNKWSELQSKLRDELEEYVNPLYEQADGAYELEQLMFEVEHDKGLLLEPSIQLGYGGIWIYDDKSWEILAEGVDYSSFCEHAIDLALESKDEITFKNKYSKMLNELIR